MPKASKFPFWLGALICLISPAVFPTVSSIAATASGVFTSESGTPLAEHQLHFENRVSGDIYLARTGADGSFSTELPPGLYDLRAERGLVVKAGVIVGQDDVEVGHVTSGAPFDVRRPFEREGIGPALVQTEAPATAHVGAAGPPAAANPGAFLQ